MSRSNIENRPRNGDERPSEGPDAPKPNGGGPNRGSDGPRQSPPPTPRGPSLHHRPALWIVLAIVAIGGGIFFLVYWFDLRFKLTTDDAFIAAHSTTVSPRVSGHVLRVMVDDNQDVKQGDPLVVLDDRDFMQTLKGYQAALEQANAQLVQAQAQRASALASVAQAKADVASAEANATQARSDLERYESVLKVDPRAVSKQEVDQATATARTTAAQLDANQQKQGAAEAQVKVAQAQIVAAQAAIDKAQSDVDNAKLQLSYTTINAAEAGRVTNRSVEVGNYISPGQALMALVPHNVWVTANYKETELHRMRVGQRVKIHIDAYDVDLDGHVNSIQAGTGAAFSLLPPENATGNYVKVVQRIPVKITFDQMPGYQLAPGMSVEPTVETK